MATTSCFVHKVIRGSISGLLMESSPSVAWLNRQSSLSHLISLLSMFISRSLLRTKKRRLGRKWALTNAHEF